MSDELKPCPFCGSEAEIVNEGGQFLVGCLNADTCAISPFIILDIQDVENAESKAVAGWNWRADS